MPRIYMIRHGEAAASWDSDRDPGLSDLGWSQAEQAAEEIRKRVEGPLRVLTSPLKRCQETAQPLAKSWGSEAVIEPRVAEVPSPDMDVSERGVWLRGIMQGTWDEAAKETARGVDLPAWKKGIVETLLGQEGDTVVFSHFVAINAAVSHALDSDKVLCFQPGNGSVTIFETEGDDLSLIEQGGEAETRVL